MSFVVAGTGAGAPSRTTFSYVLSCLHAESREVNQAHQSPRLDRFAAYKTEGSKLEFEDVRSSSSSVHETIDSSVFHKGCDS
ncbi:hypothetical protein Bca4012_025133 [Brassica carinata]